MNQNCTSSPEQVPQKIPHWGARRPPARSYAPVDPTPMEPPPEQGNESANDDHSEPGGDESSGAPGEGNPDSESAEPKDDAPWWGRGKPPPPYDISERRESFIEATLAPFGEPTRQFFRHVLVSSLLGLKASRNESYGRTDRDREERSQGYVPVDSGYREKYFRGDDWRALRDAGLIDVLPYSVEEKLAYRFRPTATFIEEFRRAGTPESVGEAERIAKESRVDVVTGEITRAKVKTRYTDKNGRRYPELIDAGLRAMEDCPIVYGRDTSEGILRHLHLRYRQLLDTGWRPSDGVPHPKWEPVQSRAYHRYANDERCASALLSQGFRHVEGGLAMYKPAYKVITPGRTAQVNGGLQSCSGEMKGAAYTALSAYGHDVRNYDMVAAHLNLFAAFMREADLPADWMEKYLGVQHARPFYAGAVELDEGVWKRLTLAVLMGAHVPEPQEVADRKAWWRLKNVTVVEAIDEAAWEVMEKEGLIRRLGGERGKLTEESTDAYWFIRAGLYRKFYLFTRDMRGGIDRWQRHLIETLVEGGKRSNFDGRVYVTNKAGMKKGIGPVPGDEKGRQKVSSELAAFMLQGAEAAVVHALASVGKKYGFSPVANEHDGLITLGPVPGEAVQEAAEKAGIDPAAVSLEEKAFKEALV